MPSSALRSDGLQHRVGHRAMVEGADEAPLAVHLQVARSPDDGRADITGEDRILIRQLADESRDVLRVNDPALGAALRQYVQVSPGRRVVLESAVQVQGVRLVVEVGQQSPNGVLDVADDAEVDAAAVAQGFGPQVDLDDARILRIERTVWEVRAQEQKGVAALHGCVAGGEPHQAGHADIIRIVVLEVFLAAEGVHDWCLQYPSQLDHLVMRTSTPRAAKQRDALADVEIRRQLGQVIFARQQHRLAWKQPVGDLRFQGLESHVSRHHDHRDAALGHGDAHGPVQDLRQLLWPRDEFDVVAALLEQDLGMRGLEVVDPDFAARDMRCDGQYRHAVALAVEQAVDEVQVAGATAASADRERARQMSLSAGGKCCALLVADVHPFDLTVHAPQRVRESVE